MIHSSHSHRASASKREQEYLAGWKRARAELKNFKDRMQQESGEQRARLTQDVLEGFISVADNMYALVAHQPPELEGNPWTQGVIHIARQFDQTLQDYGVTMIDQAGVEFNTKEHEAIEEQEAVDIPSGQILKVVSRGYMVGERVIKPAKVIISK